MPAATLPKDDAWLPAFKPRNQGIIVTTESKRDWNKDGRVITVQDARQVVESYRLSYSPGRFQSLMRQAAARGRATEIDAIFEFSKR